MITLFIIPGKDILVLPEIKKENLTWDSGRNRFRWFTIGFQI